MSEVGDERDRRDRPGLGRTGAAVLSAALITARIAMQRRAELADKARREGELRRQQVARQLSDAAGTTVLDAGVADERGQICLDGEDPARLAGMGFASSTHDAVARAAERAAKRPGAPRSSPRRTPKVHRGDERAGNTPRERQLPYRFLIGCG
jgi:hypothetical protein